MKHDFTDEDVRREDRDMMVGLVVVMMMVAIFKVILG